MEWADFEARYGGSDNNTVQNSDRLNNKLVAEFVLGANVLQTVTTSAQPASGTAVKTYVDAQIQSAIIASWGGAY